jgi:hypothetical protein
MYLCSNGHKDIAYDKGDCPACECKTLLEDALNELHRANEERAEEVDKLKDKIQELEAGREPDHYI